METRRGCLAVKTTGRNFEISNGQVSAHLVVRDCGYDQEFYAVNKNGVFVPLLSSISKNLIPSSEHRACASPMISGRRTHLFGVCRESLRMVYSRAEIIHHDESKAVVRLTGSVQEHNLTCDITIEADSSAIHVQVEDSMQRWGGDPVVEYLMSSYAFVPGQQPFASREELDYTWTPILRPANDHVIGDRAFHSPAVIVRQGRCAAALIPDLDILNANREMAAALDLDLHNGLLSAPLLSYGFCGHEPADDGRHCLHDMTMSRRLPAARLVYGFHLVLDAASGRDSVPAKVARFLWKTYGKRNARATFMRAQNPPWPAGLDPAATPDARAAYGAWALAREQGDRQLAASAKRMLDMAISAPQDNGLFPTRFDAKRDEWKGCQNALDNACYSAAECSAQAYWLLRWNADVESDPIIVSYCRRYADFLIGAKLRTGAIPSWYTRDRVPLSALRSSAETAISAAFLAELANATGLKLCLRAAEHSAKFVMNHIIPRRLFLDHTCFDTDKRRSFDQADPHTGARIQTGQAMLWTARMCASLYRLTRNRTYLQRGREVIEHMCLLQSVLEGPWSPDGAPFGSCVTGNMGSQPDPELTAEFAGCAMRYGALTGDKDYFERGAAALRAAARMCPAHAQSGARVAASIAAARTAFGAAYVHVGRRWGVELVGSGNGWLDFGRGSLSIDLRSHPNGNGTNRVVFGGLRGASYKLNINGHSLSCSRDDMESGIPIPADMRLL